MRLIDLTRKSIGWNNPFQTRTTNQIQNIGIHHSATDIGSQAIFENHWRNLGWRNGGYSEIILQNGDVEICYAPTIVTNGIGGHNQNTYHICTVGNSNFTAAQEQSLVERIRFNMNRFQIPIERVLGHNEFTGHASTICPGRNMNMLRSNLRLPSVTPPVPNPPKDNHTSTHAVRSGDTLWSIANRHRTTVSTLRNLNNLRTDIIHPGQVLQLPASSNNLSTNDNSNRAISIGSRVRVNNNAQSWATGQSIPAWVRGQSYTVKQIRNNNSELLLAGIISWIRLSDVTLI